MNCTACKVGNLTPSYLEGLFPCSSCDHCGGNLIMLTDYLRWKDDNKNADFTSDRESTLVIDETERAMICPKTGRLMTKYRISGDTEHRLDLSPTINAIWLDAGEWQLLKQRGLAGRLNNIFTDHWQREIVSQESAEILTALYERKFGEHYETIKAFRALLEQFDDKHEAIAYLLADDPYKA